MRDNKPGLRFAGLWDFPGGGREGSETPVECAIREIDEEFSLKLKSEAFIWQKEYPAMIEIGHTAYFLVAEISKEETSAIKFGSEGQRWDLMSTKDFLERDDVVPHLKTRLSDYLLR